MLLLLACAEPGGGDTATPVETDPIEQALGALPECAPGADDGRLDVEGACADDACIGSTYQEAEDALGRRVSCFYLVDGAYCNWSSGITLAFADTDADGTPDEDGTAFLLSINRPWDGGTADGLALDATLGCYVDALGTPDIVSFGHVDEGWVPRTMTWDALFFSLYDTQDADGAGGPDGLPDFVQFTNYLYY